MSIEIGSRRDPLERLYGISADLRRLGHLFIETDIPFGQTLLLYGEVARECLTLVESDIEKREKDRGVGRQGGV